LLKKFPKLLPKAVDVLLAALNEGDKKVALEIFQISGLSYRLKKAPWPRFFGSSRPCKVKPRRRARGVFFGGEKWFTYYFHLALRQAEV